MQKLSVSIVTGLFTLCLFNLGLFAQGPENDVQVHFYPHPLSSQDILQDGPDGDQIEISNDTFLVWVDFHPGMFFAHETVFILIARENVRVVPGNWWPVLNGKMILHNEIGGFALLSPFELQLISDEVACGEQIAIHVYPQQLLREDELADGPEGNLFGIDDNSLLIWVDFYPGAFFVHPTAYVLVSRGDIRVESGGWWPVLNGRSVLYNQPNRIGIVSPFTISWNDCLEKPTKQPPRRIE